MRLALSSIYSFCMVLSLYSGTMFAQCPTGTGECIHFTIIAKSQAYKLGDPIIVNMVFTNMSDHILRLDLIHAGDQGYGYHFEVTEIRTGKRLERTDEGKELAWENQGGPDPNPNKAVVPLIMGGGSIPLEPHETRSYRTILSRIFDFKEPGTYRVEVLRDASEFQVAPITITVVP